MKVWLIFKKIFAFLVLQNVWDDPDAVDSDWWPIVWLEAKMVDFELLLLQEWLNPLMNVNDWLNGAGSNCCKSSIEWQAYCMDRLVVDHPILFTTTAGWLCVAARGFHVARSHWYMGQTRKMHPRPVCTISGEKLWLPLCVRHCTTGKCERRNTNPVTKTTDSECRKSSHDK